jgi:uncharacterized protein (DUF58 family)
VHLHPTRSAVDIALVGIAVAAVGVVFQRPAILAWGSALLIGLAIARAVTVLSVATIRTSGFEMLWREAARTCRIARGQTVELEAEVRNRDTRAARYVALRTVAHPDLETTIVPSSGEVPAGGRLRVTVTVRARRVGRQGIFGLSLEVRGSPGLFEVPLTFSNPYGIEVLPAPYATALRPARGGRSRASAEDGRPGPLPGDGLELREIRELQPGDPFKRIAWKASARRGKLLVREYEREERDVVWVLLDASVELWSGRVGSAPLDLAIDEVATVALAHLGHGDRVALGIAGARPLATVPPGKGPRHGATILHTLATATGTLDADRSDLDLEEVAERVLEHLRPLDPPLAASLRVRDPDRMAAKIRPVLDRAPCGPIDVHASSAVERALREYLGRFGVGSPPRQQPEAGLADATLAQLLEEALASRPRPSLVYIWSPAPDLSIRPEIARALGRRPRRGLELRWVPMRFGPGLARATELEAAVADAMDLRLLVAATHGERALAHLGVRVERIRPRTGTRLAATGEPPAAESQGDTA